MKKSDIKAAMKKEYQAGEKRYSRLWDALVFLYNKGLVSEAEREYIIEVNHELSKK